MQGRTPNTKCYTCGVHFYKRPGTKAITKHHFCSRECYRSWRITHDERRRRKKNCKFCSARFLPARREQVFCSVKCAASRPLNKRRNGAGKNRSSSLLDKLRELGWDGKCMVGGCEYQEFHEVHRIVSGKDGGKYETENIAAICPNHHREIHILKREFEFNIAA